MAFMIDLWYYGPRYIVPPATPATSLGEGGGVRDMCWGSGARDVQSCDLYFPEPELGIFTV